MFTAPHITKNHSVIEKGRPEIRRNTFCRSKKSLCCRAVICMIFNIALHKKGIFFCITSAYSTGKAAGLFKITAVYFHADILIDLLCIKSCLCICSRFHFCNLVLLSLLKHLLSFYLFYFLTQPFLLVLFPFSSRRLGHSLFLRLLIFYKIVNRITVCLVKILRNDRIVYGTNFVHRKKQKTVLLKPLGYLLSNKDSCFLVKINKDVTHKNNICVLVKR